MKYFILSILLLSFNPNAENIEDRYHEALINDFGLNFNGKATNECLQTELQSFFASEVDNVNAVYLYSKTFKEKENLYVFKVDGTHQNSPTSFAVKVSENSFKSQSFESTGVDCQLGYCKTDPNGYCSSAPPIGLICGCEDSKGECIVF